MFKILLFVMIACQIFHGKGKPWRVGERACDVDGRLEAWLGETDRHGLFGCHYTCLVKTGIEWFEIE